MTVAVAAMAFTGCSNTFEEVAPVQTSKFTVNAVAEDMTRTAFGEYNSTNKTYKTLWDSEEDKVKVPAAPLNPEGFPSGSVLTSIFSVLVLIGFTIS